MDGSGSGRPKSVYGGVPKIHRARGGYHHARKRAYPQPVIYAATATSDDRCLIDPQWGAVLKCMRSV
jgi:hypothetical protein